MLGCWILFICGLWVWVGLRLRALGFGYLFKMGFACVMISGSVVCFRMLLLLLYCLMVGCLWLGAGCLFSCWFGCFIVSCFWVVWFVLAVVITVGGGFDVLILRFVGLLGFVFCEVR